jgi:hypothetical protein
MGRNAEMKPLVVVATGLLLTASVLPAHADGCGMGQKVNNYNNMTDPDPSDREAIMKIIINHLNDDYHSADYAGCTKTEMQQADGVATDFIDYLRHNPNSQTDDAIAYAKSVQQRLRDAIARLDDQ